MDKKNAENYSDHTAARGISAADKKLYFERQKKRAEKLRRVFLYSADLAGFEIAGAICLIDKRTRRAL